MALRTPLSVTPHLYMGDSTGRPLDKGVVYFGEQDKDPEFYPINLFSDDALTKPLAQPVHTKGGYLYDKGDMVEPHAKELIYSVKVLDSYGRKVFYKGAMMRNSWNDDVIEQINTAIIGSADAARQVAIDITNDAINNTAVEGGVLADTFVTVTAPQITGGISRTQREVNSENITSGLFGMKSGGLVDNTPMLQNAIDSGVKEIEIVRGVYKISGTLNSSKDVQLIAQQGTEFVGENTNDLLSLSSSIKLKNIKISGFKNVLSIEPSVESIGTIDLVDCEISNCQAIVSWATTLRDRTLKRLSVIDCDIKNISNCGIWIDSDVDLVLFARNKVDTISRYIIRTLFGDSNEIIRSNYYIDGNTISNITGGDFTGEAGVARCFQIAADNVWIKNNNFKYVSSATANANILYGDINNLTVTYNTHIDCGSDNGSYLYHDKSLNGYNHKFIGNTFTQSDSSEYTQNIIQSTADNTIAAFNQFEGIRGICFYAGWGTARNIAYAFNQHRNLKGFSAVRFYGQLDNIIHCNNIYDGISNDKGTIDSGRLGVCFVDIGISSGAYAPKKIISHHNIYQNSNNYAGTGEINAAVLIASHETSEVFSFDNELFDNVKDGIHFRVNRRVQAVRIVNNTFMSNVTNKIRYASGATYKPVDLFADNNSGIKTKNSGRVTLGVGVTNADVQHGLTLNSGSDAIVQITPSSPQPTLFVTGKLLNTFSIRRTDSDSAVDVDWYATT